MAERSTPRSAEQAGRHRVAPELKGIDRHQQQDAGSDVNPRMMPPYVPIPDPPARPRNPKWLWLIPVGAMAIGAMLGILPFLEEFGGPPDGAIPLPAPVTSQELTGEPSEALETPAPPQTPTAAPTSRRAAAAPAATRTAPTSSPSAEPVLLGPSSNDGLQTMVQRYCDRHAGGLADPRGDGRWQCVRLLSSSIADLDIACRDAYGSAAYAQTSNSDDPYAWRCYR